MVAAAPLAQHEVALGGAYLLAAAAIIGKPGLGVVHQQGGPHLAFGIVLVGIVDELQAQQLVHLAVPTGLHHALLDVGVLVVQVGNAQLELQVVGLVLRAILRLVEHIVSGPCRADSDEEQEHEHQR